MKTSHIIFAAYGAVCSIGAMATPTVVTSSNAIQLANSIVGPGVTLVAGSTSLTQASTGGLQAGTFSGGLSSVGFQNGVVLSTGNINSIPGPNTTGTETLGGLGGIPISTDFSGGGSAPGAAFDRVTLQFSFRVGDGTASSNIGVRYVFASEEYIDFVGSIFNDIFSFELDGTNIAIIPGTSSPVSINSVNPTSNSAYYINNVANTNGFGNAGRDFQFDGLTTFLTASAPLSPGIHTIRFSIADISDGVYDSAVFIQSFAVPEPSATWLFGGGLGAIGAMVRRNRKTKK